MQESQKNRVIWQVGQSIVTELSLVLELMTCSFPGMEPEVMPDHVLHLGRQVPHAWLEEIKAMSRSGSGPWDALLVASRLAGTLVGENYSEATMPVRELNLNEALTRSTAQAALWAISPDLSLGPKACLVELLVNLKLTLFREIGVNWISDETRERQVRLEMSFVPRILPSGDLHSRFWHLLDRFYYETYAPWRNAQGEMLRQIETQAVNQLGGRKGTRYPEIEWLPPQNPLLQFTQIKDVVQRKNLRVFFMVEPLGIFDFVGLQPPLVIVSCSPADLDMARTRAFAQSIAGKLKALSDPSRLLILRLISEFSMSNTQMGNFLGLSRPAVSIHAKILREAGLIESYAEGRETKHKLKPQAVRSLLRQIEHMLRLEPGTAETTNSGVVTPTNADLDTSRKNKIRIV